MLGQNIQGFKNSKNALSFIQNDFGCCLFSEALTALESYAQIEPGMYDIVYLLVLNTLASAIVSGIFCLLVSGRKNVRTPPISMVIPIISGPRPTPNTVVTC